ncbi:actin subfamily protein [Acanthamoeba castellanii str. Neff]|uniref:Actin subfamily protein n=1 Tax=Acanthamoeba castellanii (strain ATCC 30010 / Neff) TaxID=1257118 RepID=L8HDD3_ACACF|nr:actin subfamily protein [Acanthamoeba castellanii str. Neff]ELR22406.1 actin subfamily protein [Acanthamoeba castellanii str. Neff]
MAALVVDCGGSALRVGVGGEALPRLVMPSVVGQPRKLQATTTTAQTAASGSNACELAFRAQALQNRSEYTIKYLMYHGVVSSWEMAEQLWGAAFTEMKVETEEHPVLLAEDPLVPCVSREKAAQVFFEHFNVPAYYAASQRRTGLVVDIGQDKTNVLSVYEGHTLRYSSGRHQLMPIGGLALTDYFMQLVSDPKEHSFATTRERDLLRKVKEQVCFTSLHYDDDLAILVKQSQIRLAGPRWGNLAGTYLDNLPNEVLERIDQVADRNEIRQRVKLGDGRSCRPRAPGVEVRVESPARPGLAVWEGGSILASQPSFEGAWMTKHDYDEYGNARPLLSASVSDDISGKQQDSGLLWRQLGVGSIPTSNGF